MISIGIGGGVRVNEMTVGRMDGWMAAEASMVGSADSLRRLGTLEAPRRTTVCCSVEALSGG